jgi:hypothetical protein
MRLNYRTTFPQYCLMVNQKLVDNGERPLPIFTDRLPSTLRYRSKTQHWLHDCWRLGYWVRTGVADVRRARRRK